MRRSQDTIQKQIVTPSGEDEFAIRWIGDEDVGIVTTRSEQSYFVLDSKEFWYDLTQTRYPSRKKCACKNEYFKLWFDYVPRGGTDDYREIKITAECTACKKHKKIACIKVDYSPSSLLFEQPITFCAKPRIKYRIYLEGGFWQMRELQDLVSFLAEKQLHMYRFYWGETEHKRHFEQISPTELQQKLSPGEYLDVYFSTEPMDAVLEAAVVGEDGIMLDRDLWRTQELFCLHDPITIMGKTRRVWYEMTFCSEYIDADGNVQQKSKAFCRLAKEVSRYCQEHLTGKNAFTKESHIDQKRFFELIMTVCDWDASGDDDKVLKPLIRHLARQSDEIIFAFDDMMAELLYALDTRKNYKIARRCRRFIFDDRFLYSRCVALINGEEYYQKVKSQMVTSLWQKEFEAILYVPALAWAKKHRKTMDEYPHVTPKSYETKSNLEGWKR